MNDDQMLRLPLIATFLVVLSIGAYHRIKSQATQEPLDRRQEGVFILATLRPFGAAFWIGSIVWTINPAWMAWSSMSIPGWVRWAAVSVLALGAALTVWTFRSLGPNLTDTVVTRRHHTLVVHGPYQWVRHPFYVSGALLMASLSVITANWFLLVTGTVVICLLVMRTRTEEANLIARFGDGYRAYVERTGRFVPRLSRRA
jgi:protein-S-isoprenylcysteine O-methyltransferase Ste14